MKYLALPLAAACLFAADRSPEARAWWSHVEYLASDALEGRRAGTPGHTKAAQYVASEFEKIGLKPGGTKGGYIQPVSLETRRLNEAASSIDFVTNGGATRIQIGEQAVLGIRVDEPGKVEAHVVFAGHCLKVPEAKIDDMADIDLKGKVAFCLSGAPSHLPAPLAAHSQSTAERWKALKAAGAIGTMTFTDPRTTDIPWSRSSLTRLAPVIALTDPALIDNKGVKVSIAVNPEHANIFLAGTGHTSEELLELHRANKPLPHFLLKGKVRVNTVFSAAPTTSENVIGVLPGETKEAVIISAHLDHLGIGGAIKGDSLYNGAMDNASGVASVIEAARILSTRKLKRTVLFAAVTGEEGGLMGSKHFAAYPTVPAGDIVADINLDMFLPIVPLKALTVYGLDESDLGPEFASIAGKAGVKVERDPQPARNIFIRSDQYSLIRRGIPALTFKFHAQAGSPEDAVMRDWLKQRYHAPSDDLQQPVELEAAAQFNRIITEFIEDVANRPTRPQWKKESFFRRYAQAK